MRTSLLLLATVAALAGSAAALAGTAAADPAPVAGAGTDYAAQVRVVYRVAACGGDDAIPERIPARTIKEHCAEMADLYRSFKHQWADPAERFIAPLRPRDLTTTAIYPFGGGDLSSALAVYPDATELTTISLEAAGDIRTIDTIKPGKLASDLDDVATILRRLYRSAYSATKSLQVASHSQLPGTIVMALAGMTLHGMEPVSLRYFDIEADGGLRYLSNDELDARAADFAATKRGQTPPKAYTHYWYMQESPFSNVEIQFRPIGADPHAPLRTYRHIVANLDDPHMAEDDRVLKHLAKKGKVAVMTKAATFLLWYDDFSRVRDYLLAHTAWMISDASGIPPSYAGPAGYEQIPYGEFTGPYFVIDEKNTRAQFIQLWKDSPHHDLPFRFGYPDNANHNHLMITRPKGSP